MFTIPLTISSVGLSTICDLRTRKIPNAITLPVILIGLILASYTQGIPGLERSILGTLLGLALLLIPFGLGGIGAGDVKLLAAIGALNGPEFVLYAFVYGAIAGGLIASVIVIVKGRLYTTLLNVVTLLQRTLTLITKGTTQEASPTVQSGIKFPYGIALFTGVIATYLLG